MAKRVVIAIDGPAGAGKSTIARRVAARLGFVYVDTGAMYRALALWAIRAGVDLEDAHRLEQLAAEARIEFEPGGSRVLLNGEDVTEAIRAPEVGSAASRISVFAGVRRAMVAEQRRIARQASVVMEGRDIGTVVFPAADVKIFLDASPEARAQRRLRELRERGQDVPAEQVAAELEERDRRDRSRAEAPLMQAPDAVYLDTTALSLEQVEQAVLRIVRERVANGQQPG
ncbi:MAG: (d)CMP kinase [Bryobacterales bacterium]|nr:(d)CMP kinase [Bryobacteraceae bacterium]MDW8129156.1 (d)CMP kinase [Bryobacterales bacterium]